jgi:TRAP-type C4-dicarboxylate transport system substrate-binding protein
MKTRGSLGGVFCITLMLVALLILAPGPSQAQEKVIQLKYATGEPQGAPMNASDLEWIKKVEERTGGRVKVTLFQGTMGKITELYDMVIGGVVDVVHMGSGWAGGRMPLAELVDLPFATPNMEIAGKVLEGLYSQGLLKELDPFKVLMIHSTIPGGFFLRNKKVTTLEEFAGLKIRPIPGPPTELVKAWGAVPVAVRTPDLFMALDKGEIDGMFSGPDSVAAKKQYEPCKYQVRLNTFGGAWVVLMNKNTWNNFPPDVQKVIDQVNKEVHDFYYSFMLQEINKAQAILDKNLEVYSLSPSEETRWRKAAVPVTEKWIADREAKGLAASKVVETMRTIVAKEQKK